MGFRIDKQTLNDLAILSAGANKSVYEIFNRTHTREGQNCWKKCSSILSRNVT